MNCVKEDNENVPNLIVKCSQQKIAVTEQNFYLFIYCNNYLKLIFTLIRN